MTILYISSCVVRERVGHKYCREINITTVLTFEIWFWGKNLSIPWTATKTSKKGDSLTWQKGYKIRINSLNSLA